MPDEREYLEMAIHGRGGQGVKTAGDLLVHALFETGFRVNGQPLYGGERMGAPIVYFIRFSRSAARIDDRSLVRRPDIMVVFDSTVVASTPDLLHGLAAGGVLLLNSGKTAVELARVVPRLTATLPASRIAKECGLVRGSVPIVGPVMVGAFARATGLVSLAALEQCVEKATGDMPRDRVEGNFSGLRRGYEAVPSLADGWRGGERKQRAW
jgi:phenylglyoxylate dehydrogenase gamma subunit